MAVQFRPGMKTTPAPNVHETVVDGWAHCTDPRCGGYGQQPVRLVQQVVEHTVGSRGGGGIFANIVENSNEYLRFADETDVPCPECSGDRDASMQERPVYPPITGFAQDGLLHVDPYDASKRNTPADEAQAAEMAEMRKQLAELRSALQGSSSGD